MKLAFELNLNKRYLCCAVQMLFVFSILLFNIIIIIIIIFIIISADTNFVHFSLQE